jgi:hypothetical protein
LHLEGYTEGRVKTCNGAIEDESYAEPTTDRR